jgi:hypothetical protein
MASYIRRAAGDCMHGHSRLLSAQSSKVLIHGSVYSVGFSLTSAPPGVIATKHRSIDGFAACPIEDHGITSNVRLCLPNSAQPKAARCNLAPRAHSPRRE